MSEQEIWPRNRWWGPPWPTAENPAEACSDPSLKLESHPAESDPDAVCLMCEQEICYADSGITSLYVVAFDQPASMGYIHKECQLRSVVGNLVHVRGECRWTGDCVSSSTKSYRQEALEVWEWFVTKGATDG